MAKLLPMRTWLLPLLILSALALPSPAAQPASASSTALYRVLTTRAHVPPPLQAVRLTIGPVEHTATADLHWWQMDLLSTAGADQPLVQIRAATSRPLLAASAEPLIFHRYQLRIPSAGETLEYRNLHTSRALLPSWGNFQHWFLPHPSPGSDLQDAFPQTAHLLGQVLSLRQVSRAQWQPWTDAKTLTLDPELLIGTGRTFKDKEGHRIPQQPEKHDYTYVPWTLDDYRSMIDAGFNCFMLAPGSAAFVRTQPVFYLGGAECVTYPVDLYRSNFLGPVMYLDEPACILPGDKQVNELVQHWSDATDLLTQRVRVQGEDATYRLDSALRKAGVNFGDMRLAQTDFAIWETRYETTWYQLAGGSAGLVQEGRYQLPEFNRWLRASTGIDRDWTAAQMLRYQFAVMRGAARHFHRNWGISIYGQADPALSPQAMQLAYDMGARYCWYWTSDHAHHLPFNEQLALTRTLRQHIAAHPRPSIRSAPPLRDKLILLPPARFLAIESPDNRRNPWDLWWIRDMDPPGRNAASQQYRRLVTRAFTEINNALDAHEDFDISVDDGTTPAGYKTITKIPR